MYYIGIGICTIFRTWHMYEMEYFNCIYIHHIFLLMIVLLAFLLKLREIARDKCMFLF